MTILDALGTLHFKPAATGWVTAILMLALSVVGVPPSHAIENEGVEAMAVDLSAYEGHWQRIEATEYDEARESAIDKAISGLSWIVRTMASGVLRRTTKPPPEMQFAWDGMRLHQGMSGDQGEFSRVVELDGDLVTRKDHRGVDFDSAWRFKNGELRLQWEQHQALGNNTYRLDDSAEQLIVRHTIIVTAISNVDPIVFESRFGRTERPARDAAGLDHVARASAD